MAMLSALAEDERLRIIKRTHEGRKIAQAKGVRMGRKPKLTPHQREEVRIPTKPAMHSNRKPATCSELKPAGVPI